MYKYTLDKIYFKNNNTIIPKSLTVIVGPNNCGKSRILKDILSLTTHERPQTVILKDLDFSMPDSLEELKSSYQLNTYKDNNGNVYLRTLSSSMLSRHDLHVGVDWEANCSTWLSQKTPYAISNYRSWFGNFFITLLSTEDRLRIIKESPSGDVNIVVENLLQAFYKEGIRSENILRKIIKEAFNMDLKLDFTSLINLVFRIGSDMNNIPSDPREARPILETMEKLDDQGDGLKSFIATILSILVGNRPVLLLDEPEAFLHPPQSYKLGEIIAQQSSRDRQVIIATHSSDFLRGILNIRQDITLIRVERSGNHNEIFPLAPEEVAYISNDPLLSSSRILEGLFYKGAVVVEADSDSIFYQKISRQIRNSDDVHYTHAHNKQTVAKVIEPYKTLGIKYATIIDFDILRVTDEFKPLLKKVGFLESDISKIIDLQKDIVKEIELKDPKEQLDAITCDINQLLDDIQTQKTFQNLGTINLEIRRKLKKIREDNSPWRNYKDKGYMALSHDGQQKFHEIYKLCSEKGIFIVPVGELESWLVEYEVPKVSNKSKWITVALEKIPTLIADKEKYPWKFIEEIHNYLFAGMVGEEKIGGIRDIKNSNIKV